MPFDRNQPTEFTLADAGQIRAQFNALFDLFMAGSITGVQMDAVNSIDPGQPASVTAQIIDGVMHFTFNIPRGAPGGPGPAGPQGPPFANAIIGGVATLNAGENAWVTMSFDGTNVQFFFGIPRGIDGSGGITPQQLDNAILGTSRNTNNVATLNQTADADYNPTQMQALMNKLDEHINSARR